MAQDKKKRGSKGPSKATIAAKQADAAAKAADAQKAAAEAAAKQSADALELKKLELAEGRRAADKSPGEQIRQGVINVGAPVAGMVAGYKLSKMIERRQNATVAVRNQEISKLAAEARKTMSRGPASTRPVRLQGIATSAKKLDLGKIKGPLGLAPAAIIVGEGVYSRFYLAPQIQNETAREAMTSVGTASLFAATTLVGERILQNATPAALPNARDVATIETATAMAAKGGAPAATPSIAGRFGRALAGAAKRIALPAAVGVTVFAASQKAAEAGETKSDVAKAGGKAGLDLLTGGALSEFDKAKAEGLSDGLARTRAVVAGVANTLTLGGAGAIADAAKSKGSVGYDPAAGARKYRQNAAAMKGRAYLNAGAEAKAAQVPTFKAPTTARRGAGAGNRADGRTEGYTRVSASGLVVQVQGYSTPKR